MSKIRIGNSILCSKENGQRSGFKKSPNAREENKRTRCREREASESEAKAEKREGM